MDLNITLNISAPDLCSALNNLAGAIASKAVQAPVIELPAPTEAEAPAAEEKPAKKAPAKKSTKKKAEEAPVAQAAPTAAPTAPVSAPAQTVPTAPVAAPAAVPVAPVAAPVAAPAAAPAKPAITMADISRAGAALVESVGIAPVQDLIIKKYGVRSIQQLDPSRYEDFAADLRALGAQI